MTVPETVAVPAAPLQRALDRVSDIAIGVASLALLGLVVVQGWQVFTRYVLNNSPSWTEPVTLLLLSTALSLAAAAGVHTNRHFGFYLLGDHVPPLVRKLFDLIRPLMIMAIGAVLAWWSAALLIDGLDIKMAGAQMPQSINYLPLSVGGALMVVFALYKLWRVLRPIHTGGVR
ncbi:TRAP transporter small permease [Xanthomonas dyei]|uniref:TRAP transporter small permease n=1 Tax=Xanthomonas TaxID=338 RepID=UPI0006FC8A6E|nr:MULTISPECIES: TRAP transporter small permease subunit [Xanthomonas]KQR08159.1 C4-dicarboxylate ABC transporter [Xanthomonas sp. Leaf148]